MTAAGTLWRQIHELAKIVDRHPIEGLAVERLAIELRDLPTAKRQNVQHDLHLLSRWLQMLVRQQPADRSSVRHSLVKTNRWQERLLEKGQMEDGAAKELARSLSELDDDGSPVLDGDCDE